MFSLDLPTKEVYVCYENGTEECVGMIDVLPEREANSFKDSWEKSDCRVVRVELRDGNKVLASFTF